MSIVCDSSVCLPKSLLGPLEINIVPLQLFIEGHSYLDGIDINASEFYSMLPKLKTPPKTSAPSPMKFIEVFSKAYETKNNVVCLTVSSTVSSTYQTALSTANNISDIMPSTGTIDVIDTQTAAGAYGLVVLAAARAAIGGASVQDVINKANQVMRDVTLLAITNNFWHLHASGRLPWIAALAGSALKLNPIIEMAHGDIRPIERPRTRGRAIKRLVSIMNERMGNKTLTANIMHALSDVEAQFLRDSILDDMNCVEIIVSDFSPVMGAHTGAGLIGVAFHSTGMV